ncbi:MAG: hypothetical protein EOO85_28920, partial [Pedobacter sp.]
MDLTLMPKIKELYNNGGNIIAFLKSQDDRKVNNIEDIIISYDFQSGSYIKFVEENGLHINKDKMRFGRIKGMLQGV